MNALASFDTHAFVRKLADSGMAEQQATALAEALGDIVFATTATKADLRGLETKLSTDLRELEIKLSSDMRELETKLSTDLRELELRLASKLELTGKDVELRLMTRMGAMFAASTALTVAILGALITLN